MAKLEYSIFVHSNYTVIFYKRTTIIDRSIITTNRCVCARVIFFFNENTTEKNSENIFVLIFKICMFKLRCHISLTDDNL